MLAEDLITRDWNGLDVFSRAHPVRGCRWQELPDFYGNLIPDMGGVIKNPTCSFTYYVPFFFTEVVYYNTFLNTFFKVIYGDLFICR